MLQFEEGGIVLRATLQLSYRAPSNVTLPTNLADLTAVLLAVEKYGLNSAQPSVWSFWHGIASTQPLQAYCYAIRAGHTLCAKEAAKCILNQDLEGLYVDELGGTPALAYHRLLMYYEKCCTVAKEEFGNISNALRVPPPLDTAPLPPPLASEISAVPLPLQEGISVLSGQTQRSVHRRQESSWLERYVCDLSSQFQVRPGSDLPALSQLFVDATRTYSEDRGRRVWCKRCQPVADQILKVDKALRRFPDNLSKVSRSCPLFCGLPTVTRCAMLMATLVLRSSLRYDTMAK